MLVPTGLFFEVPEGYEAQVRARSGLAVKYGIGLVNGIGTVDADYRGEVKVPLINWGSEPFVIRNGERIAQVVINRIEQVEMVSAEELSETELAQFCVDLPRYKRPRKIIFAPVIRNATGKIDKPKLREIYCGVRLVEKQNNS